MPYIIIAEDHAVVRLGTILLIRELYPDAAIAEADTFDEVLVLLESKKEVNLILLDIHMAGGDNMNMIEAIHLRNPAVPVLVFSNYEEQVYALPYIQAGAMGYLSKNTPATQIKVAIRQVMEGERYLSRQLREQLLEKAIAPSKKADTVSVLSPRELEVLQLLVKGVPPVRIKELLNIQLSTVSTYKARIFEKMNVSNVIDLADKVRMMQ